MTDTKNKYIYILIIILALLSFYCPIFAGYQTIAITASADDAEEDVSDGSVSINDVELEFTTDAVDAEQYIGLRFNNVNIPRNSTVTSAYIQLGSHSGPGDGTYTVYSIYAQKADHASTFSTTTSDISSRQLTTSQAFWAPRVWGANTRGANQKTVDLSAVIQEVVNRAGWKKGNSIAIIIKQSSGTGTRVAESFDGIDATTDSTNLILSWNEPASSRTYGASLIQRGSLSFAATSSTVTLATAVDTNRSILLYSFSVNDADPNDFTVGAELTASNQITFYNLGGTATVKARWQVITFQTGIWVQRGNSTTGSTTVTVNLAKAVDTSKAFVIGGRIKSGAAFGSDDVNRFDLTGPQTLQIIAGNSPTNTAYWQVIEGDSLFVQQLDITHATTDALIKRYKIPTSVDTTKTILIGGMTLSGDIQGDDAPRFYLSHVDSVTSVHLDNDVDVGYTIYVVEWRDGSAVKRYTQTFATTDDSLQVTITSVDTNVTAVVGSGPFGIQGSSNATSDHGGAFWNASHLASATKVDLIRNRGSTTFTDTVTFQVISFPAYKPDYQLWEYSKNWIMNTTTSGANVSGDVVNFPTLLRLTSANFNFSQARGSGQDIRFAKPDGTHFPYHIERWDSTNALAEVWILIDTIFAGDNTQYFTMSWGNDNVSDSSSGSSVFKTSNNWEAVWHMDSTLDVSGSGNHATKKTLNSEPATATTNCLIGRCQDFDGADDYMDIANSTSLDMGSSFTASFWLRWEGGVANNQYERMISRKNAWNDANGWELLLKNNDTDLEFLDADAGVGEGISEASLAWSAAEWTNVAYVFNGTTVRTYVNGILLSNKTAMTGAADNDNNITFGDDANHDEANLDGKLDEVSLYDGVQSADWLKLAYENQRAANTLLSQGINVWDGGGSDNKWSTAGNWSKDVVPTTGDSVVFNETSAKPCSLSTKATIASIKFTSAYTGTFTFADSLLILRVADFDGAEVINEDPGYLAFTGKEPQIFIPPKAEAMPDVVINTISRVTIKNNGLTTGTGNGLWIANGQVFLGSQTLTHTIGGRLDATSAGTTLLDFGNAKLQVADDLEFNNLDTVYAGTGSLILNKASSTQTLYGHANDTLPQIQAAGATTVTFGTNAILCKSYTQTAGGLNFNSLNISTSANFILSGLTNSALSNLAGRTITVKGKAHFQGVSSGSQINIDPTSSWTLTVTGELTCLFCDLNNSNAGGGSAGIAYSSTNGGSNTNWSFDSEDLTTWTYSDTWYLNTTSTGDKTSGNVYNYPVPLRLLSSNFTFAQAATSGTDFRLTKTNGTPLKFEIEKWNNTDSAVIWVRLDTLYANKKTQAIKAYWGKASVSTKSNPSGVFPTTDGWALVHHFESGTDATSNANNLTKKNLGTAGAPSDATCIVGDCWDFDGNKNYATLNNSASLDVGSAFTVEVWIKEESGATPGNDDVIISRKDAFNSATGWEVAMNAADNSGFEFRRNNGSDVISNFVYYWPDNIWNHCTFLVNGTNLVAYYQGDSLTTYTLSQAVSDNDFGISLGTDTDSSNGNNFNGKLEEFRLNDGLLSKDWIKADYMTQRSGARIFGIVPLVTGLSNTDTVWAYQQDKDTVKVQFELWDMGTATNTITGAYRHTDSSDWHNMTTVSGNHGAGISSNAKDTDRSFKWKVSTDLSAGFEHKYLIRVIGNDGTYSDTSYSDSIVIDTKSPTGLASLSSGNHSSAWVELAWTAATDTYFNHYEIWYGTSQSDVQNRTGTASEWDNDNHAELASATADSTRITGLTGNTTYYFKIWAIDNAGNVMTMSDISVATSSNMASPTWSLTGLGSLNGGAIGTSAIYLGSDDDKLYSVSLSSGATNWTYNTGSYGDCNPPSYIYDGSKYDLYFTAGNWLMARQDDGNSSSEIFIPQNLAYAAGNPYTTSDDSYLFVTYTNKVTKRSRSTGAVQSGWPVTLTGVSTSVDPAVYSDQLFVATTAGVVNKYDMDGTLSGTYDMKTAMNQPLLSISTVLYAVSSAKDSLIALNRSTMAKKWAVKLTTNPSGPPFSSGDGIGTIWVPVGTRVEKIADAGASASVTWTSPAASDSVKSGPIMPDSVVYFGVKGGSYYSIKNSDGTVKTNWPYTPPVGDANVGPWIDITNNRVLFGTINGELDAFTLQ